MPAAIAMFVICILISGWLAAQTDAAKNTNSTTPARAEQRPLTPVPAVAAVRPTMTLTLSVTTTSCRSTSGKSQKYPGRFRFARMAKYHCL